MENEIVEEIIKKMENAYNENFDSFGIRKDIREYKVGEICANSHNFFVDPVYDENGELVYPEGTGIFEGYYDAGELDGSSATVIYNDTKEYVKSALEKSKRYQYSGTHTYLIGGDASEGGNDIDEIIVRNAKILMVID